MLFFPYYELAQIIYILFGLLTFCGFIAYDTYEMHRRFECGQIDHYVHALQLFLDIINLFVKIVRLLAIAKNKKSNKSKK